VRSLHLASLLVACAACRAPISEEPEDAAQNVETFYVDDHFAIATGLDAPATRAQRASAAVVVPLKGPDGRTMTAADGTPLRATCGSTFVTRRHAITAAHCVPASDLAPEDPLIVQLIDVERDVDWRATTRVRGRFPNFRTERATVGYRTTDLRCRVKVRCGVAFGLLACPTEANPTLASSDIALLECDDELPAGREPVRVASSDDARGPVEMFWFHEIYDVDAPAPEESDLFRHYTRLGDPKDNFHYFGNDRNQLFPLHAKPWATGERRRRLGRETPTTVQTDLFGCHGTSGSGVLQRNRATGELELLGPVATGAGPGWTGLLCANTNVYRPGAPMLTYTAHEATQQVAQLAR